MSARYPHRVLWKWLREAVQAAGETGVPIEWHTCVICGHEYQRARDCVTTHICDECEELLREMEEIMREDEEEAGGVPDGFHRTDDVDLAAWEKGACENEAEEGELDGGTD